MQEALVAVTKSAQGCAHTNVTTKGRKRVSAERAVSYLQRRDLREIERGLLIYAEVEPVGVQQAGGGAPYER